MPRMWSPALMAYVLRFVNETASAQAASPLDAEEEARRLADEEAIRRATGGGAVVIERDRGGFKLPGT